MAGQNEQGQTILISQGADGQSQCLVVATESLQLEESQAVQITEEGVIQAHEPMLVQQAAETTETEAGIADEESMVAQLISADPPSPGKFLVFFNICITIIYLFMIVFQVVEGM